MASVLVDGLRLPLLVAGDPALDFCNTRAGWHGPAPREYLASYQHLAGWARWATLIDARTQRQALQAAGADPVAAAAVTAEAIVLREALLAVLVPQSGSADASTVLSPGRRSAPWRLLSAQAARAQAAVELTPRPADRGGGGPGALAGWAPAAGTDPLLAPYLAVVRSVTVLLTGQAARSVRACPMPDCGWVFADPSGRRRWCSMALCGNRAKARRHAARRRAPAPATR